MKEVMDNIRNWMILHPHGSKEECIAEDDSKELIQLFSINNKPYNSIYDNEQRVDKDKWN